MTDRANIRVQPVNAPVKLTEFPDELQMSAPHG
jgi:hypothetical protein